MTFETVHFENSIFKFQKMERKIALFAAFTLPLYIFVAYRSIDKIGDLAENLEINEENQKIDSYDCSRDVKIGEEGQFNLILILSVKGSGNTWTKQLFQSLTGYYAGGMYHEIPESLDTDELYQNSSFPGEHFLPESGRVLGKFD